MREQRQHYNEEFKKRTVKFVQEQTKAVPEIAEELNIPVGTLRQWLAKYREFDNEPLASPDRIRELEMQLLELQRQKDEANRDNNELREELAILKKAMHIFSKPRN